MRILAFLVVSAFVAMVACSSEDEGYDGPQSPCSTGTPYTFETVFPSLSRDVAQGLPECVQRCGDDSHGAGSWPTTSALPTGSCEHDGERCSMPAWRERVCPDGSKVTCSLTGYECHCEDSTWRCYMSNIVGASACVCDRPDAGSNDGG
jgi:hypothetical protein